MKKKIFLYGCFLTFILFSIVGCGANNNEKNNIDNKTFINNVFENINNKEFINYDLNINLTTKLNNVEACFILEGNALSDLKTLNTQMSVNIQENSDSNINTDFYIKNDNSISFYYKNYDNWMKLDTAFTINDNFIKNLDKYFDKENSSVRYDSNNNTYTYSGNIINIDSYVKNIKIPVTLITDKDFNLTEISLSTSNIPINLFGASGKIVNTNINIKINNYDKSFIEYPDELKQAASINEIYNIDISKILENINGSVGENETTSFISQIQTTEENTTEEETTTKITLDDYFLEVGANIIDLYNPITLDDLETVLGCEFNDETGTPIMEYENDTVISCKIDDDGYVYYIKIESLDPTIKLLNISLGSSPEDVINILGNPTNNLSNVITYDNIEDILSLSIYKNDTQVTAISLLMY